MTMTSKRTVLAVVVAVWILSTGATAQELPGETPTPTQTPETPGEQIDESTRLVSAEYNDEDDTVTVVIASDTLQDIVVSDAGAFVEGGVVPQRTATAKPGEQTTIVIPVTRTDEGFVGVSIATRETLYAVPIRVVDPLNPWTKTTSQDGWLGGISVSIAMIGLAAWRTKRKSPDAPEGVE